MAPDSRARMVRSAAELISERGLTDTSFTDVLARSGAPRGSIYHHFPAGKDELAAAAVELVRDQVLAHLAARPPGGDPAAVLRHFMTLGEAMVLASDGARGCAIAGVALDLETDTGSGNDSNPAAGDGAQSEADAGARTGRGAEVDLVTCVRLAFGAWVDALSQALLDAGLEPARCRGAATTVVDGFSRSS